jgi:hypothetical protein
MNNNHQSHQSHHKHDVRKAVEPILKLRDELGSKGEKEMEMAGQACMGLYPCAKKPDESERSECLDEYRVKLVNLLEKNGSPSSKASSKSSSKSASKPSKSKSKGKSSKKGGRARSRSRSKSRSKSRSRSR